MKITPEVREFAAKQNTGVESFVAGEDAEAGMAEMSRVFRETGWQLYMGAGGREHDRFCNVGLGRGSLRDYRTD